MNRRLEVACAAFAALALLTACQEPLVVVMDEEQARAAGLLPDAGAAPSPSGSPPAVATAAPAEQGTGGSGPDGTREEPCGSPATVVGREGTRLELSFEDGRREHISLGEETAYPGVVLSVPSDAVLGARVWVLEAPRGGDALAISAAPLTAADCRRFGR